MNALFALGVGSTSACASIGPAAALPPRHGAIGAAVCRGLTAWLPCSA